MMLFNKKLVLTTNTLLYAAGGVAAVFVIALVIWFFGGRNIAIVNNGDGGTPSPLTGMPCARPEQRPVAVMLASDPIARPLSGIAAADVVVEMPVTPNGITRMMAIFQCRYPEEVGSVRSAREDFTPLAGAFDALLAHWGGEQQALALLKSGIIDNIDALRYEGSVFFRKPGVKAPHNGFTTIERILETAQQLAYRTTTAFAGYPHQAKPERKNLATMADTFTIDYPSPYDVTWTYQGPTNRYRRTRGGTPETDAIDEATVEAGAIAVVETTGSFIYDQYIRVAVQGQGNARLYQNGTITTATWKRDASPSGKLLFLDGAGKEIPLAPGPLWIEVSLSQPLL